MKKQILQLNKDGQSQKEIASIVGCSVVNVGYHLSRHIRERVNQQTRTRRRATLEHIKKQAGGKCKVCGYNRCLEALDFHHIKDKTATVNYLRRNASIAKLEAEVKKCVLLCCRCHRELHNGIIAL